MSRTEITAAVHDNLRNLGLDVLEVVNMRSMLSNDAPAKGSIEGPLAILADLQRQGLVRHIGLSNVTPAQIAEGRDSQKCAPTLEDEISLRLMSCWYTAYQRYVTQSKLPRMDQQICLPIVATLTSGPPMEERWRRQSRDRDRFFHESTANSRQALPLAQQAVRASNPVRFRGSLACRHSFFSRH